MKCPHCQIEFHDETEQIQIHPDQDGFWFLESRRCPACGRLVLELVSHQVIKIRGVAPQPGEETTRYLVRPKTASRPKPAPEVPLDLAADYAEAALVLSDSPKASAALSRRCLQNLLRETAGVKHSNLAKEIDEVLASKTLPSHLAGAIDTIRIIGNFAAHPIKSTASGQVVPVEPGEAEWTLDVLDGLFDFYFVQPALLKRKKDALDAKLASAKKPPTK